MSPCSPCAPRWLPGQPGEPRRPSGGGGALATHVEAQVNQGASGVGRGARLSGRMLSERDPGDVGGKLTRAPRCLCEAGPRLPFEGTDFRPDALQFRALSDLAGVEEGGPQVMPRRKVPGGATGVLVPGGSHRAGTSDRLVGLPRWCW